MDKTIQYLFILALVLILVAYFAGANKLGQTAFAGINNLGLTFTGRNSQGAFSAYPGNAPA
jgi:hypothetical protein